MTPDQIDRVFGRGRLKMVTGDHVEVFREAVAPGERRRYTKRFLNSSDGNFAHWTEREWRILARLIGHGVACVPDVVQFDRGSAAGIHLVQTYDAGVTVDQWATLLPLMRDGHLYRHAFEDCAHWWALAHHCLVALQQIHLLQLVHLDVKGDNVCIPLGPPDFDPDASGTRLYPKFAQLALIDFAFALVSRESLTVPLPIGWQRDYDYQSPRLLNALEDGHDGDLRRTRELDWRCDIYSLAAMLKRYLPDAGVSHQPERVTGWTSERYDAAKALILTLRDHHDRDAPQVLPHQELIDVTDARLRDKDLARSLEAGWTLARDADVTPAGASPLTPMTRLAVPLRVFVSPRDHASPRAWPAIRVAHDDATGPTLVTARVRPARTPVRRHGAGIAALTSAVIVALGAAFAYEAFPDETRELTEGARAWLDRTLPSGDSAPPSLADAGTSTRAPAATNPAARNSEPPATPAPPPAEAPKAVAPAPAPPTNAGPAHETPDANATGSQALPTSPSVRASPKESLSSEKMARGQGKHSTTKATAPSLARPPAPAALAKTPPPERMAMLHALPSTSAAPSSIRSARLPESPSVSAAAPSRAPSPAAQSAAEPIPATAADTASPSAPSPLPLAPQPSAISQPPSVVALAPAPAAAPVIESSVPAATAPVSDARPPRAPPVSEEGGMLSRLLGFAKPKAAPIEDRSPNAATPLAKPAAPPASPSPRPQERVVAASPKVDIPPAALTTISIGQAPPSAQSSQPSPPRAPVTRDEPQTPVAAPPAPAAVPPAATEIVRPERNRENEYAKQARRVLADGVPRIAAQAQNEISRLLWAAANAKDPAQERAVADIAHAIWMRSGTPALAEDTDPAAARQLNDKALQAYGLRGSFSEAFDLQLKAYGANPYDPAIAGNLAYLYLRIRPAQPEMARQLALQAIAVRGAQQPFGRIEDWNTYAVASALTGRDADSRNALFVTVALARNVERNCRDAAHAIATYGERVREPVDAMMYRIYTQGRAYGSPYCNWPPSWAVGMRR